MTDNELVKQVLNGNQGACRYLVLKYQKLVFHMVRRILVQTEDCEDVCQEVFMKVFSQIGNFRGNSKLSTWVATIAYHTSLTALTGKQKVQGNYTDPLLIPELPATEYGNVESEEVRKYLLKLVETLPLHYRTVLTLYYLEEFSYREIEEITGMPGGTVKSYLSRAKFLLKCKLEKMQEHENAAIFRGY